VYSFFVTLFLSIPPFPFFIYFYYYLPF
jgi:hypothetical protein